ncbi:MAG: PIN domain-containing protein [Actinomycetales bacterium]|nr:PIN domain-containing protein [Actinomycetales bacterium]
MKVSAPRVYFDTSVFVAIMLGPEAADHEAALTAVSAAQQGHTTGVASALVVAEVVGAPALRAPQGVPQAEALRRVQKAIEYFQRADLLYVEAGRQEGVRAAEIARDFNMKGADALHVALAEAARCATLFSLDNDHLKIGESIPGLHIQRPSGHAQVGIDLGDE